MWGSGHNGIAQLTGWDHILCVWGGGGGGQDHKRKGLWTTKGWQGDIRTVYPLIHSPSSPPTLRALTTTVPGWTTALGRETINTSSTLSPSSLPSSSVALCGVFCPLCCTQTI